MNPGQTSRWNSITGVGRVSIGMCRESWFVPKVQKYFSQFPIKEDYIQALELQRMLTSTRLSFTNYRFTMSFIDNLDYVLKRRGEIF